MTAERNESPNISPEKRGTNVSGVLYLNTDDGSLIINIESATILSGEVTISGSEPEVAEVDYRKEAEKARSGLNNYFESLPVAGEEYRKQLKRWEDKWDSDYDKYGEDALIGLFPRETDKDIRSITRTFKSLDRHIAFDYEGDLEGNICTKAHLAELHIGELSNIRNVGTKSKELAELMRNVVITERRLEEGEV